MSKHLKTKLIDTFDGTSDNEYEYDKFLDSLSDELTKIPIKNNCFLEIKNGGWRKLHGLTCVIKMTAHYILRKIWVNGFSLKLEKRGSQLIITRYSHDEPTGATIYIHPQSKYQTMRTAIFSK